MKQSTLKLCLLVLCFSLIVVSCKKEAGDDSTAPGPDVTYITDGYLGTMGTTVTNTFDTLFFDISAFSLGRPMAGWGFGGEKPEDQLTLITQNNGSPQIKLKIPYGSGSLTYLWIRPDPTAFPVYPYYFSMASDVNTNVSELQFIIKRSDSDSRKFTIESKQYPGNFLNIVRPSGSLQTIQSKLVFTPAKKEFFFITK